MVVLQQQCDNASLIIFISTTTTTIYYSSSKRRNTILTRQRGIGEGVGACDGVGPLIPRTDLACLGDTMSVLGDNHYLLTKVRIALQQTHEVILSKHVDVRVDLADNRDQHGQ